MRTWSLGPGDPLQLTLAADFRLCSPDYSNDHIWEVEPGGGDPPALALTTTYGLRARRMRIFPRFHLQNTALSDPAGFAVPPVLRRFAPNFLHFTCEPFPALQVNIEYWVPDSHTVAGRIGFLNRGAEPVSVLLELCAQLVPIDGQPMAETTMQAVNVLAGRTSDLSPVIFLTGGPLPGPGPYPSLTVDLALAAGGTRTLTWVEAALASASESFDHARRVAARPWDAEIAHLELVNAADTVEIHTGDPDWDAAFALTQKQAFSLFMGPGAHLPAASFVLARQPDHGYSHPGDGTDAPPVWSGQTALESAYLASCLPGAPHLLAGLIQNFLSTQLPDGTVDGKPGLLGQRGRWQCPPLLARMAWDYARRSGDFEFLRGVYPKLTSFLGSWLSDVHDRDGDTFPEWDHPTQAGLEDHPRYQPGQPESQASGLPYVETPALAAMLASEFRALAKIAAALRMPVSAQEHTTTAKHLSAHVEVCWDDGKGLYRARDRDSHLSPGGQEVIVQSGPGKVTVRQSFGQPRRLLVRLQFKSAQVRYPHIVLRGRLSHTARMEQFERADFQWSEESATAITRGLFTSLSSLEVAGIEKRDRVTVRVMDFQDEDLSLFLPLWAGIPSLGRVHTLLHRHLLAADRFGRPFGFPWMASPSLKPADACEAVHIPWNAMLGEGLLAYGLREEAARLTARLMAAVIESLKKQRAFYRAYHAETGKGLGERNPVQGLAPLGLFLQALGVEIHSPCQVTLRGKNPFPWPVTVKYRGLVVTRQMEKTTVAFPDGQTVILDDPTDAVITEE
jgi:hypothetical protein